MKKMLFVIMVSCLFASVLMAQTEIAVGQMEKIEHGQVVFKAHKQDNRYFVFLQINVPAQKNSYTVKAVKISFEPSGTIPLALYAENCTDNERTMFTIGQKVLSSIETPSFGDFSPYVSLDYPSSIEKDTLVKIEYLIENDGIVSTMLAAYGAFSTSDAIAFSVTPLQKEAFKNGPIPEQGKPYKFCCYGTTPPTCVYCSEPGGTCCPSCDIHYANCGAITCPPPPC